MLMDCVSALGKTLDQMAEVSGSNGEVHVSSDLAKLLNVTDQVSQKRNDQFISSEMFVKRPVTAHGN